MIRIQALNGKRGYYQVLKLRALFGTFKELPNGGRDVNRGVV